MQCQTWPTHEILEAILMGPTMSVFAMTNYTYNKNAVDSVIVCISQHANSKRAPLYATPLQDSAVIV